MVLVKVNDENGKFLKEYFIERRLKENLDEKVIKQIQRKDKDCVIIVDGAEGSGKSTLAFQIGKYVDPTLNIDRVVFSPDDFREAVLKAKKGQCIVYDEAFTGFSSRASLSPINRVLVSLAMQMRQKNLFVLIVLPTIYLLDRYMAMFRTKALIHVFEHKSKRGYFRLFNKKKKKLLILFGYKTMSYSHKLAWTKFRGRFYGKFALGDEEVERLYLIKKEKALSDSEKTKMNPTQVKNIQQRDCLIYLYRRDQKKTYEEMEIMLKKAGLDISLEQISRICNKFAKIYEIEGTIKQKNEEKRLKRMKELGLDTLDDENEGKT